jgi:hypothetical protein
MSGTLVSLLRGVATGMALLALAGAATSHGLFEKPFYNRKTNYTTRGVANGGATILYMMQPHRHMTGAHETIGWRTTMQDEEGNTQETVKFRFIKFAANGVDPDTTATGTVVSSTYRLFGFGDQGITVREFLLTVGFPQPLPDNFGIAVEIPANTTWPKDGASIHAQLNIQNDSRRPRVLPPHDRNVWAFEQPGATIAPVPLGGRTLDTLAIGPVFIEPTLTVWNRSPAYGLGFEDLYGPESVFPVAARGDMIGVEVNGGQVGVSGLGLLYVAPDLTMTPIPLPIGAVLLSLKPPFPVHVVTLELDNFGIGRLEPFPFTVVPPEARSFWLQAIVVNPWSLEIEATDAVGVLGQ